MSRVRVNVMMDAKQLVLIDTICNKAEIKRSYFIEMACGKLIIDCLKEQQENQKKEEA